MSRPSGILTSIGQGICHHPDHGDIPMTGRVITNSPDVRTGEQYCARVGDIVLSECGHTGIIVDGVDTILINGRIRAKVDSRFEGDFEGVLISGQNNFLIGE